MAGRPRGSEARTEIVHVRFGPKAAAAMDHYRGGMSRSAYIRMLVQNDILTKKEKNQ